MIRELVYPDSLTEEAESTTLYTYTAEGLLETVEIK